MSLTKIMITLFLASGLMHAAANDEQQASLCRQAYRAVVNYPLIKIIGGSSAGKTLNRMLDTPEKQEVFGALGALVLIGGIAANTSTIVYYAKGYAVDYIVGDLISPATDRIINLIVDGEPHLRSRTFSRAAGLRIAEEIKLCIRK